MKKQDPEVVRISGVKSKAIVGEMPIVKMLDFGGVRTFALHRCFFQPSQWKVTELRTGCTVGLGMTKTRAIADAKAKAEAGAKKHGDMKKALAWGYRRLKRRGVKFA